MAGNGGNPPKGAANGDGRSSKGKGKGASSNEAPASKLFSSQGILSDLTQTLTSASGGKLSTPSTRLAESTAAGLDTYLERNTAGSSSSDAAQTGGSSFRTLTQSDSIAQDSRGQTANDSYASFGSSSSASVAVVAAEVRNDDGTDWRRIEGDTKLRIHPLPVSGPDATGGYHHAFQLDGPLHEVVRASHQLGNSGATSSLADEFQQSLSLKSAAEADAAQERIYENAWPGMDPTHPSFHTATSSSLASRPTHHPPPTDFLSALAAEEATSGPVSQEPSSTDLYTLSSRPLRDPSSRTNATLPHPLDHILPHPPSSLASQPYRSPSPSANNMSHEQATMHRNLALLQSSTQDPARVAERVVPPGPAAAAVIGASDGVSDEWEVQEKLRRDGRDVYAPTPEMALRAVFGDGADDVQRSVSADRATGVTSAAGRFTQYLPQGSYIDDVYGLPPMLAQTLREAEQPPTPSETQDTRDRRAKAVARLEALQRHLATASSSSPSAPAPKQEEQRKLDLWEMEAWMRAHVQRNG